MQTATRLVGALLIIAMVGCRAAPSTPPDTAIHAPAAVASQVTPVADPLAGLACDPPREGWARTCTAPGYEITGTVTDCDTDTASLASVVTGTDVLERFPSTTKPATVAKLSPGQMVCIHYRAQSHNDGPGWRYVTAIDASMVKACERKCTTPHAAVAWVGRKPQLPCRVSHAGYSAGCASGWIRADGLDEYSMGLPSAAEPATQSPDEVYGDALPDATIYSVTRASGYACVVGANLDDLGRQSAVVAKFTAGRTAPEWTTRIPHDPDFYGNRATHCACATDRCYVLVATDTQPAQSTSQTLISIARLSPSGAIAATRDLTSIPGAPANASAWLDSGASHFVLTGQSIELTGLWRASPEDAPHPFKVQVPTF